MSDVVNDFLDFFMLSELFSSEDISVLDFLKGSLVAFIALAFTLVMLRFIMEIVKIITDWVRWR